ncbi:MAG: sigma-70 family RNA polymerase sigma factor [Kofleriaceae bacterium]
MFEIANVEKVIRHLVRFGSTPVDAEDLAQETLLIAWRKQAEREPGRELDAWLYGIARNVFRNHARASRLRETDPVPDDVNQPDRELVDVMTLHDAIHTLPEAQQDLVTLHELEGFTLKETAALLDVPFDTAKDRLKRAREGLRGAIAIDVDAAIARERPATNRLAKASSAVVLAGVLASLARSGTATAATVATGIAVKTVIVAVLASLAVGVGVGIGIDRAIRPPRERVVTAPAPLQTVASPLDAALPDAPPDAPVDAPGAPVRTVIIPHDAADPSSIDAEAQTIVQARSALAQGRTDDALRALMSHERRFPNGQLAEQRDVLLIEAYLAAGRLEIVRDRIAAYRRDHPTGIHADRVDAAEAELQRR